MPKPLSSPSRLADSIISSSLFLRVPDSTLSIRVFLSCCRFYSSFCLKLDLPPSSNLPPSQSLLTFPLGRLNPEINNPHASNLLLPYNKTTVSDSFRGTNPDCKQALGIGDHRRLRIRYGPRPFIRKSVCISGTESISWKSKGPLPIEDVMAKDKDLHFVVASTR